MLRLSNLDVLETLREFRARGIEVAFLVPTETGLHKSIMDATDGVRLLLSSAGIHHFSKQPQGADHKRLVPTTLISGSEVVSTQTSLYRPETKSGDPRIWIYGLKEHARAGDLLALVRSPDGLVAINCSTTNLGILLAYRVAETKEGLERDGLRARSPSVPIPQLVMPALASSEGFEELMGMMRNVSSRGYVATMRIGDTGVGYTLESLLGIKANSAKAPDFRGIEIKSGRARSHLRGQTTMFSQVPDWKLSRLKGSKEILQARGKFSESKGRRQLFHEISALAPNSYGLQLELDQAASRMHQVFISGPDRELDVTWAIERLKERLLEKHRESVWVTAQCRGVGSVEEFWYNQLTHTDRVDAEALPLLLQIGAITVHYTIKELPNGAAKDQGYLFKTSSRNLELLFSKVEKIELSDAVPSA